MLSRRRLIAGAAAAAGAALLPAAIGGPAAAHAHSAAPFLLGVASGDPLPGGVILWTRLVNDPYDATSMGRRTIPVAWQVAHDESGHPTIVAA